MKLSKTISLLTLTLAVLVGGNASANVVEHLHETMQSGATFDGNLTFADNYSKLLDVDGYLTGASYVDDHFTWTWRSQNGDSGMNTTPVSGVRNDWLMDGLEGYGYANYIGITWAYPANTLAIDIAPELAIYYAGYDKTDRVISATVTPVTDAGRNVPEPASIALLGLGFAGMSALRRKKNA